MTFGLMSAGCTVDSSLRTASNAWMKLGQRATLYAQRNSALPLLDSKIKLYREKGV